MKIKFTILGCGSSLGVPRIDGNFGNCDPKIKKNYRTRCSALISFNNYNILIDTSPDIKYQLLKNKVKNINKIFYTHMHGDQTHGINEIRYFYIKSQKRVDIYADHETSKYLKKNFSYCFKSTHNYPAILKHNKLKKKYSFNFNNHNIKIENFTVQHGNVKSILYIINNICAYASDVSKIYNKDLNKLFNLKYLIIDCLRYKYHPSHLNLENVLNLIKLIKPKNTILTNLHSDIDYLKIKKFLPNNVKPAFDGMSFLI